MAISKEIFFIEANAPNTLQSQIRQFVVQSILSGHFKAGEKMPSSRALAAHLGISRLTVTLAYQYLIADDYLLSKGRSGYYISKHAPKPAQITFTKRQDNIDWARALGQHFSEIDNIEKPDDWQSYHYPFIYGQTDPTLFDHKNWRLCALQALGFRDFTTLVNDYNTRDDPKLVEFIMRHILPRRGILADENEILITAGAQNALWLTAQILLNQRRTAILEEPCYPGLRNIIHKVRCNILSIPIDSEGLVISALPDDLDVVFTTPSHQCPTNATMSIARRKELLDRAKKHDFFIVEDDYEFEMSFLKTPTPALKSLDNDGRVIYVGSFSKSLFPGLRLGYLVGSPPFIREARALRSIIMRHIPSHIQRTAAYFLAYGYYDTHIKNIRHNFMKRRTIMNEAIAMTGLKIAGIPSFGGSAFWMEAPLGVNSVNIAHKAREASILIEAGAPFFAHKGPHNFYRIAYSSIPENRIAEGIKKLSQIIYHSN